MARFAATLPRSPQRHRKPPLRIRPRRRGIKSRAGQQRLGLAGTVLVAVLGMDGFSRGEVDGEIEGDDADLLRCAADKMHLDAGFGRVPEGAMGEGIRIEVRAELAIEAHQNVPIEGRGDAGGIVVGGEERGFVLDEVDAEEQAVAGF